MELNINLNRQQAIILAVILALFVLLFATVHFLINTSVSSIIYETNFTKYANLYSPTALSFHMQNGFNQLRHKLQGQTQYTKTGPRGMLEIQEPGAVSGGYNITAPYKNENSGILMSENINEEPASIITTENDNSALITPGDILETVTEIAETVADDTASNLNSLTTDGGAIGLAGDELAYEDIPNGIQLGTQTPAISAQQYQQTQAEGQRIAQPAKNKGFFGKLKDTLSSIFTPSAQEYSSAQNSQYYPVKSLPGYGGYEILKKDIQQKRPLYYGNYSPNFSQVEPEKKTIIPGNYTTVNAQTVAGYQRIASQDQRQENSTAPAITNQQKQYSETSRDNETTANETTASGLNDLIKSNNATRTPINKKHFKQTENNKFAGIIPTTPQTQTQKEILSKYNTAIKQSGGTAKTQIADYHEMKFSGFNTYDGLYDNRPNIAKADDRYKNMRTYFVQRH